MQRTGLARPGQDGIDKYFLGPSRDSVTQISYTQTSSGFFPFCHSLSRTPKTSTMPTDADRARLGVWGVILDPDLNIDRRKSHRTVPLEVLSLGCSRTGTLSMVEALKILGYPDPYHYSSVFANVSDADMWQTAFRAKYGTGEIGLGAARIGPEGGATGKGEGAMDWRAYFDRLLGHCGAVTDSPVIYFWEELLQAYPDAKVIVVERNVEKWLPSIGALLDGVLNPVARYVLRFTDPMWFGRISNLGATWMGAFFGSTNLAQAKKNAREAYAAYYARVYAGVPQERMIKYELGSGWEPLCKFLGKEIPDVPFPHCNEAETLDRAIGAFLGKALKHSLFNIAVLVGVSAVAYAILRQSMY